MGTRTLEFKNAEFDFVLEVEFVLDGDDVLAFLGSEDVSSAVFDKAGRKFRAEIRREIQDPTFEKDEDYHYERYRDEQLAEQVR